MRILGISGSFRRDSHNTRLLRAAALAAAARGGARALRRPRRRAALLRGRRRRPGSRGRRSACARRSSRRRRAADRHARVQRLDPGRAQERDRLGLAALPGQRAARQAGRGDRGEHGSVRRGLGPGRAAQGAAPHRGARCSTRAAGRRWPTRPSRPPASWPTRSCRGGSRTCWTARARVTCGRPMSESQPTEIRTRGSSSGLSAGGLEPALELISEDFVVEVPRLDVRRARRLPGATTALGATSPASTADRGRALRADRVRRGGRRGDRLDAPHRAAAPSAGSTWSSTPPSSPGSRTARSTRMRPYPDMDSAREALGLADSVGPDAPTRTRRRPCCCAPPPRPRRPTPGSRSARR